MSDGQLWWLLFFAVVFGFAVLRIAYRPAKRGASRLASGLVYRLGYCPICLWVGRGMGWRYAINEARRCHR